MGHRNPLLFLVLQDYLQVSLWVTIHMVTHMNELRRIWNIWQENAVFHCAIGWQRPHEWPIFAGHFRQKSTVFSCSFAGKELKAEPSDVSSPCCTFESKIEPYVSDQKTILFPCFSLIRTLANTFVRTFLISQSIHIHMMLAAVSSFCSHTQTHTHANTYANVHTSGAQMERCLKQPYACSSRTRAQK